MRDHKELFTCNVSKWYMKNTRLSVTGKMDDGINLSSFDSATTSKRRKNRRARFKIQIKIRCLSLEAEDDVPFNKRFKKTCLCTKASKFHAQKLSG